MGHWSKDRAAFDKEAAHPHVPAMNAGDTRYAQVRHHHHHHHGKQHHQALAQNRWWTDGNGGGSEKEDAFEEFGRWSKDTAKFNELAANPLIPALNKYDKAPTSHSNGFTSSYAQRGPYRY
jgi:hypothetical protein